MDWRRQWAVRLAASWVCLIGLLWLASLPAGGQGNGPGLRVVATTNIVADAVRNVVGEAGTVVALMGPGVDPHLYQASQGDVRRLAEADVIFYNGLQLEGRLGDVLVRMARRVPTYAVTEYLSHEQLLEAGASGEAYDPHVWFDVRLWMRAVERIRDALVEVDPDRAETYRANAQAYLATLEELDGWVRARLALIPAERRVLVTAHDAFNYLGRAYGLEVVGLQGISTEAEYGLADVIELVDLLLERQVRAVFVETSVSGRGIQAVIEGAAARGHQVALGGELYSDALGAEGTEAGTYVGMVRHNVETMVAALAPEAVDGLPQGEV
mgnify:CR=1 FL=1